MIWIGRSGNACASPPALIVAAPATANALLNIRRAVLFSCLAFNQDTTRILLSPNEARDFQRERHSLAAHASAAVAGERIAGCRMPAGVEGARDGPAGQGDPRCGIRGAVAGAEVVEWGGDPDRKSTRLNSSHTVISYAVFCLKKKKRKRNGEHARAVT